MNQSVKDKKFTTHGVYVPGNIRVILFYTNADKDEHI